MYFFIGKKIVFTNSYNKNETFIYYYLLVINKMAITELLAISAIFLAGLYIGLKVRRAVENLKIYLNKKRTE